MVSELSGVNKDRSIQSVIAPQTKETSAKPPMPTVELDTSRPSELELTFDLEVVKRAAETVSAFIETVSRDVRVAYDDTISRSVFTVVDAETSEVIRQIPSEDLVAIARFLEAQGLESSDRKALAGVLLSEEI
ncbi:MAG: flagellar protein FlaG [Pseudomonadota bacterium]|nr:flagellar protein FlaG [Pseudomonadota bacterium]